MTLEYRKCSPPLILGKGVLPYFVHQQVLGLCGSSQRQKDVQDVELGHAAVTRQAHVRGAAQPGSHCLLHRRLLRHLGVEKNAVNGDGNSDSECWLLLCRYSCIINPGWTERLSGATRVQFIVLKRSLNYTRFHDLITDILENITKTAEATNRKPESLQEVRQFLNNAFTHLHQKWWLKTGLVQREWPHLTFQVCCNRGGIFFLHVVSL